MLRHLIQNKKYIYENLKTLLVGVVLFLLIQPYDLFPYQDNYQFILLSGIPFLAYGLSLLRIIPLRISITKFDFFFAAFLFIGFMSYLWAINGGLVLASGMTWLSYWLWVPLIRSYGNKKKFTHLPKFFVAFIFFVATQCIWLIVSQEQWSTIFRYQENYICSLLSIGLFYLWQMDSKTQYVRLRILKGALTIVVLFIVFQASTRAVLISLWAIGLFNLISYYRRKWLWLYLIISCLSLLAINGLKQVSHIRPEILFEHSKEEEADRWFMNDRSLKLICENPVQGNGLGNWILEAYKYGTQGSFKMNNPNVIIRVENHNLYAKLLSELGLIGFLPFIISFIWLKMAMLSRKNLLSEVQKSSLNIIYLYLILSSVYLCIQFSQYYYSGVIFILFLSIGWLLGSNGVHEGGKKYANVFLFSIATVAFVWQSYINLSLIDVAKAKEDRFENPINSVEVLERKINPNLFNVIGAHPLNLLVAFISQSNGNHSKADYHFKESLSVAPFDDKSMQAYANFLLKSNDNIEGAKHWAEKALSIQNNNYRSKLTLAEIAIRNQDYDLAKDYLGFTTYLEKNLVRKKIFKLREHVLSNPNPNPVKVELLKKILSNFYTYSIPLKDKYKLLTQISIKFDDCESIIQSHQTWFALFPNENLNGYYALCSCYLKKGKKARATLLVNRIQRKGGLPIPLQIKLRKLLRDN